MTGSATAWLGRRSIDGRMGRALQPLTDRLLGRGFAAQSRLRVQIYYTRSRICFAQIFPFLHHETRLGRTWGTDIRYFDMDRLLAGRISPVGADVVMVQPWFDVDKAALARALERIRGANPDARVIFLDSYAHNDLRLARTVEPFIDAYVKKSLFRDRAQYFRATLGHTNLTDYYGWQYGCAEARTDWQVPRAILAKLCLGPHFFTAPGLMEGFLGPAPDPDRARPIDLHARLGTRGTGWYRAMRTDCVERAAALPGRIVTGASVPQAAFMDEIRASKLVFSPFGYGELCWRDIEAILAGAVVVKQDMGHLETRPDLFRAWETYVPVAWDFSDLEANVARVLEDADLRAGIARAAWTTIRRHLDEGRFIAEAGALLGMDRPRAANAPSPATVLQQGTG